MSERKFNLGQIVVTKAIDERMKSSEFFKSFVKRASKPMTSLLKTVVVCFRLIFTEATKRKSGSSPNGTEA